MRVHGRARVSSRYPQAFAICDRCGFLHNRFALTFQFEYAGAGLYNTQMLVCDRCYDTPQEQLKSINIPADPLPIMNPRTQNYAQAETDYRQVSGDNSTDPNTGIPVPGGDLRSTEDDGQRVTQETGEAPGGTNQEPGTSPVVPEDAGGNDPGLPYGFDEVPKTGPLNE